MGINQLVGGSTGPNIGSCVFIREKNQVATAIKLSSEISTAIYVQALGKSGLCSRQLAGDCYKAAPQSSGHLNWAQLCGAMKMAKSCKEGTAANRRRSGSEGHKFETQCQQGLFTEESPLKSTLHLVISIHNINSCGRCIGYSTFALHVTDVT